MFFLTILHEEWIFAPLWLAIPVSLGAVMLHLVNWTELMGVVGEKSFINLFCKVLWVHPNALWESVLGTEIFNKKKINLETLIVMWLPGKRYSQMHLQIFSHHLKYAGFVAFSH